MLMTLAGYYAEVTGQSNLWPMIKILLFLGFIYKVNVSQLDHKKDADDTCGVLRRSD
jgi:hypothetical protein